VILVDANLLLYAYDLRSDQHEKSRRPSLMSLVGQTLNSPSSSYVSFHRLRIWFPKPNPEHHITIAPSRAAATARFAGLLVWRGCGSSAEVEVWPSEGERAGSAVRRLDGVVFDDN
jgi:hypothetical protein